MISLNELLSLTSLRHVVRVDADAIAAFDNSADAYAYAERTMDVLNLLNESVPGYECKVTVIDVST